MYKLRCAKLSRASESLPDSVAVALGIMKLDSLTRAVVELDKLLQVVESRPHPGLLLFSLLERKDAAFVAVPIRFRCSGCIYIGVLLARVLISMMPLWSKRRRGLLTNTQACSCSPCWRLKKPC